MADDPPLAEPLLPTLSTIHELPVEILVDIFATVDAVDSWGTLGFAHGRGIAKLMLVCRLWRDVACATPEFWRRVDAVEPLSIVLLRLERSRGCTLDVRVFYRWIKMYEPALCRDAIALVLPHAHRIRSLYVNLHMEDYPAVHQLLDGEMPALECLDLVPIRDFRHFQVIGGGADRAYATCSLSRRRYPRLRSMVAQRLYMPAPADFWRTLRRLKIYDFPRTMSREYLMQDVIAVLKANPGLEELVLWWYNDVLEPVITDSRRGSSQASQRLFALRKLRLFSIHSTVPCVMALLDHLLLPDDIPYLDIRACSGNSYIGADVLDEVVSMFGSFLPDHLRFLQERMSDVSFNGSTTPDLYMFCTPPYAPADPEMSPVRTAIAFDRYPGIHLPSNVSPGMRCLVGVLGWVPVRQLSLSGPPHPAAEDSYERMFDAFPSLEELEVGGTFRTIRADLFAALGPAAREGGGREVPRCPQLRVLAVHARDLEMQQSLEIVEAIEGCARARAEAGVAFSTIILHLWTSSTAVFQEWADEGKGHMQPLRRMCAFVDEVEHDYSDGAACCGRCIRSC